MNQNTEQGPRMFVWYESVNGVQVPKFLIPAASKHAATALVQQQGSTLGRLEAVEEADPADLIRLILPGLTMQLAAISALLGVVAQDAQERIVERSKGRLGLVKN